MTGSPDWLSLARRCVEAQRAIFAEHDNRAARTVYDGIGEGGDRALVIDRLCEDAVFAELDLLAERGHAFTAISEERGEVAFGDGGGPVLVIDPIDGSLNARRMLPSHSLSFAVAGGRSMADVEFGFVHDFGSDDEFAATRGGGATLNGQPLDTLVPGAGLEVVGIESAKPEWVGPIIAGLEGSCYRLRAIGSIAITLSYVAAGRLDGMVTARPCRSVDAAAAQLICSEAGAVSEFEGLAHEQAGLGLSERYRLIAAADPGDLGALRSAQAAVAPAP